MRKQAFISFFCLILFAVACVVLNTGVLGFKVFAQTDNLSLVEDSTPTFTIIDGKRYELGGKPVELPEIENISKNEPVPAGQGYNNFITLPNISVSDKFDLKENYFMPVENQARMGLCWAFTENKVLETFILRNFKEYFNFSEAWCAVATAYSDLTYVVGGGGHYETYEDLVNAHGVMFESQFPYEYIFNVGNLNSNQYYQQFSKETNKSLITNFDLEQIIATEGDKASNYNFIKKYLTEFGPMSVTINASTGVYGKNTAVGAGSPYYNTSYFYASNDGRNHAVTLIGWDDNYVFIDSLGTTHTGAWLIQNSWGNDYSYAYVPYDDGSVNLQLAFIKSITYNGYTFDFSKTSEENYEAYLKSSLALTSSNSNYTNINYSQAQIEQNFSQDLFVYTQDENFNNQLVYSYPSSWDKAYISAQIFKNNVEITNNFDLFHKTKENQFIITAKESALDFGSYIIKFSIDKDSDGVIDIYPVKSFTIYSGIGLSHIYNSNLSGETLFQAFNIEQTGTTAVTSPFETVNIGGDNKKGFTLSIEFGDSSKVKEISIDNYPTVSTAEAGKGYYSFAHGMSSDFALATETSYAKGIIRVVLFIQTENSLLTYEPFTAKINFLTTDGLTFSFDWHCVPYSQTSATHVGIIIKAGTQTNFDYPYYNALTLAPDVFNPTIYDKIYLPEVSKEGFSFNGWTNNVLAFSGNLPSDEGGYYVSYSNALQAGTNYFSAYAKGTTTETLFAMAIYTNFSYIQNLPDNTQINVDFVNNEFVEGSNARIVEVNSEKLQVFDVKQALNAVIEKFYINGQPYVLGENIFEYTDEIVNAAALEDEYITKSYYINSQVLIENVAIQVGEIITYSITYENIDGVLTDISNFSSTYTNKDTEISFENLTKEGYFFEGWTYQTSSGHILDVPTRDLVLSVGEGEGQINGDLTLTANFNNEDILIQYNANNGQGAYADEIVNSAGNIITKGAVSSPSQGIYKSSNALVGWKLKALTSSGTILSTEYVLNPNQTYQIAELISKIHSETGVTITAGDTIILEAVWEEYKYNFVFDLGEYDSLNGITDADLGVQNVLASRMVTMLKTENVLKTGYEILSWEIEGTNIRVPAGQSRIADILAVDAGKMINGETIYLYAVWTPIEYEIVFDFVNPYDEYQVFVPYTYNIETVILETPNPNNIPDGYYFVWVIEENSEDCVFWAGKEFEPNQSVMLENAYGDITLKGYIRENTYKITYDYGDADIFDTNAYNEISKTISYNDEIFSFETFERLETIFLKENYHIARIEINSNIIDLDDTYTNKNLVSLMQVQAQNNAEIVIKLFWEGDFYDINYYLLDVDGGTYKKINDATILSRLPFKHQFGSQTNLVDLIAEVGFVFSGWHLENQTEILESLDATAFNNHINLYGEFEVKKLTIKFFDDLGNYYENQDVILNFGETFNPSTHEFKPEKPEDAQYTYVFNAWMNKLGQGAEEVLEFEVFEDVNLYANFNSTLRSYTVNFYNYNDELLESFENVYYGFNALNLYSKTPPIKPRDNDFSYSFIGWNIDKSAVIQLNSCEVAGETNLYAIFKPVERKLQITLISDNKTFLVEEYDKNTEINLSLQKFIPDASLKNTEKYSYTFIGWFTDIQNGTLITNLTLMEDTTLYAIYEAKINQHNIYFYYVDPKDNQYREFDLFVQDGEPTNIKKYNYDTIINFADEFGEIDFPNKVSGYTYTFKGWFEKYNPSSEDISFETYQVVNDKVFYAVFEREAILITYTFFDENGEIEITSIPAETKYYNSQNVSLVISATQTNIIYKPNYTTTKISSNQYNYKFIGWFDKPLAERTGTENPITFLDFQVLTQENKLYAGFEAILREYEFTFKNANGEDITFNEIDGEKANMFAYGESIRLADVLTVPTKEQTIQYRYEFDGWFKNENLDGEKITEITLDENFFANPENLNFTFYPKFREIIQEYTVFFYNETQENLFTSRSVQYGSYVDLDAIGTPSKQPTMAFKYEFEGWYSATDTNATKTLYTKTNPMQVLGPNAIYLAQYKEIEVPYTLTMMVGGDIYKQYTFSYNTVVNLLDEQYKVEKETQKGKKFTFKGWSKNASANPTDIREMLNSVTMNMDITIYAMFVESTFIGLDQNTITLILIIAGAGIGLIAMIVLIKLLSRSGGRGLNNKKRTNSRIQELREKQEALRREREEIERRIRERNEKNSQKNQNNNQNNNQ